MGVTRDKVLEAIGDARGEGRETHKALADLEDEIRRRLEGACRELEIDWGVVLGDVDTAYAEFKVKCDEKRFTVEIGLSHTIVAEVLDVVEE
jgi:hypothetical protein